MARGRKGAFKAEKRRKEIKRLKKQEEKRKRRLQDAARADIVEGDGPSGEPEVAASGGGEPLPEQGREA